MTDFNSVLCSTLDEYQEACIPRIPNLNLPRYEKSPFIPVQHLANTEKSAHFAIHKHSEINLYPKRKPIHLVSSCFSVHKMD